MPLAYRASTSANPDPTISPAFVKANYEEYDKEREMEPRPTRARETTLVFRAGSPRALTSNHAPAHNGLMYPLTALSNNYHFYTQPIYSLPNEPAYPNRGPTSLFADSNGCITPFVHWIEDYPLPDGLKMPSHVESYDKKGDPDNYLHLFEGAIHMHKWAMPMACHMFTYTLKDSARIWWNDQKAGSILNYEDLKAKFRSQFVVSF
ncbi:hypothetical protein Tco_1364976 [Tanacetum coccineum]